MKPLSAFGWALPLLLALPAQAQHIMLAKLDDLISPVGAVHGGVLFVNSGGHLQPAIHQRPVQHGAPYFHDGFIQVANLKAAAGRMDEPTDDLNFDNSISATLTASQALENCFLVFELPKTASHNAEIGAIQIPNLPAGKAQVVHAVVQLPDAVEGKDFRILIFSGTLEVLNSTLAPDATGAVTESAYLAQADQRVRAILVVPGNTPADLAMKGITPKPVVKVKIGTDGLVEEASLASSDQPEAGPVALTAIKQWIFVPPVVNHQFVEKEMLVPVPFLAAPLGGKPNG